MANNALSVTSVRIDPGQRSDLRVSLVSAFDGRGTAGSCVVEEEVDRFLDNGQLSDTNLNRLERRVQKRLASDRAETASISGISQYSRPRPATGASMMSARSHKSEVSPLMLGGIQSAASPPKTARSARSARDPGQGADNEVGTWSEVAKHARRLEIQEIVQKRDKVKSSQQEMKDYLQKQMAEKEKRKDHVREEEARIFQHQEDEIASWKKSEVVKENLKVKAALEVKRERELQRADNSRRWQNEAAEKLDDDRRLVEVAHYDLDVENRRAAQKKQRELDAMSKLVNEWDNNRGNRDDVKRVKMQMEKKEVVEYEKMMDKLEKSKDEEMRKLCGRLRPDEIQKTLAQGTAARAAQKSEEWQSDVAFMQKQHETNLKAWQAEQDKQDRLKVKMQSNKEFLLQQVEERDGQRREVSEAKPRQKALVQLSTQEHIVSERREATARRTKNVGHRRELERQLEERAPLASDAKKSFDAMSLNELAVNRKLISEAKDLRKIINVLDQP